MFAGLVDLTADDFAGSGIEYWGFTLWDTPLCNILPYLGAAGDIINSVVSSGGSDLSTRRMVTASPCSCGLQQPLPGHENYDIPRNLGRQVSHQCCVC